MFYQFNCCKSELMFTPCQSSTSELELELLSKSSRIEMEIR